SFQVTFYGLAQMSKRAYYIFTTIPPRIEMSRISAFATGAPHFVIREKTAMENTLLTVRQNDVLSAT
ncbi:jg26526, partial [Pararge aegeria aegeria]